MPKNVHGESRGRDKDVRIGGSKEVEEEKKDTENKATKN